MKLQITIPVDQTQHYEYAAWYTNWQITAGQYDLKRTVDRQGKVFFTAQCDAVTVSDYFQSGFGGLAMGKPYDTKQNAGKLGKREMIFTPKALLIDARIELTETEYDSVIIDALAQLTHEIDISMRCLNSNLERKSLDWMSGHAEDLAKASKLYSEINGVKARREHNLTKGGGWDFANTHVSKVA